MASAILKQTQFIISSSNIRKATAVMGKTLSPETETLLAVMNNSSYTDCGPKMLAVLEQIGTDILTLS